MDIISFSVNVLLRFITANAFTHRRTERIAIKSLISIYNHPRRHQHYYHAMKFLFCGLERTTIRAAESLLVEFLGALPLTVVGDGETSK